MIQTPTALELYSHIFNLIENHGSVSEDEYFNNKAKAIALIEARDKQILAESKDILTCIADYDETADQEKGRYFEVIQKDVKKLLGYPDILKKKPTSGGWGSEFE